MTKNEKGDSTTEREALLMDKIVVLREAEEDYAVRYAMLADNAQELKEEAAGIYYDAHTIERNVRYNNLLGAIVDCEKQKQALLAYRKAITKTRTACEMMRNQILVIGTTCIIPCFEDIDVDKEKLEAEIQAIYEKTVKEKPKYKKDEDGDGSQ